VQTQADVNAPAGNGESIRFWMGAAPSELEAQRAHLALHMEIDKVFPVHAGTPVNVLVRPVLVLEAASKPHPPTSAQWRHAATFCGTERGTLRP
jgi:hypothetical protein